MESDSMNVWRLGRIAGYQSKINEIISTRVPQEDAKELTVFFGGDVQSYPEVMSAHRDHGTYIQWNLLNIATLLSTKFPSSHILVVMPHRLEMNTFSCYDNFVPSNKFGSPVHSPMSNALDHLQFLISNSLVKCKEKLAEYETTPIKDSSTAACFPSTRSDVQCSAEVKSATYHENFSRDKHINLIGFSKGCVVLNQLVREAHTIFSSPTPENENIRMFWKMIRSIYWLDGGHSGGKDTWVTDKEILTTLASFQNLSLQVHVTPYQVRDERRPWIGKECKKFVDLLQKLKADISYKLHFEDREPSLDNHFDILRTFT